MTVSSSILRNVKGEHPKHGVLHRHASALRDKLLKHFVSSGTELDKGEHDGFRNVVEYLYAVGSLMI
jgi:hypothetical protein